MKTDSLKVVSYNILAKSYVRPQWYPNNDPALLQWDQRSLALCKKISAFGADIICLQEVEPDAFDLFNNALSPLGYHGIYAQKGNKRPDGCATFIKTNQISFIESYTLYYQDRDQDPIHSGHLAIISTIKFNNRLIKLVNTHIRWVDKKLVIENSTGYRQIKELLEQYFQPDNKISWILCGDLNSEENSKIIKEIKSYGFKDAYEDNKQYTANANQRAKRIDYIFYTAPLIAIPESIPTIDNFTLLPSLIEPSDHLSIMVNFIDTED